MDIETILLKAKLSRAEQERIVLKKELELLQIKHAACFKLASLVEKLVAMTCPTPQDIEDLQIHGQEILEEIDNTI